MYDYSQMTREYFSAMDRADAATLDSLLGAKAIAIDSRAYVRGRAQILNQLPPSGLVSRVQRDWDALEVYDLGTTILVLGSFKLRFASAPAQLPYLVSVHWVCEGGRPCISFYQSMASGEMAEAAFWNQVFLVGAGFNDKPNAWLMEVAKNLPPGRALDVNMGQGRNAVGLAVQGWDVTGFDIAQEGLNLAKQAAIAHKTKIRTICSSMRDFDFGDAQWDLIAMIYSGGGPGEFASAARGLKRGGVVALEGIFEQLHPGVGRGVVFDGVSLEKLAREAGLETMRVDAPAEGPADFGPPGARPVRLLARKPR